MSPDVQYMRLALALARRGYGTTSPNPMVGSVIVQQGQIIGRGWHERAGMPHAEIVALRDAQRRGFRANGATLYVTLEPCSTHGRTPPCTEAIVAAGIRRVVVGATDPNPRHCGRGLTILRRAGVKISTGILAEECDHLNEAFNYWIVHGRPFVTVKAAMTLDGKIATANGESKWITGERARAYGMNLRQGADAVLVGINTVLADDPKLTVRAKARITKQPKIRAPRRIVLDSHARTPLKAKVVTDRFADRTTIVVSNAAPRDRQEALRRRVNVLRAPAQNGKINISWLLKKLGTEKITSLLVEGGGEVNASVLLSKQAQRVAFFYAPKILGGANARKAVSGVGAKTLGEGLDLTEVHWRRLGLDWLLTARIRSKP